MKIPFLLGRVIFGGFFIYSGIHHFRELKGLAQYAGAKKIPQPEVATGVSGALLVAGGASIALGLQPKFGALAIIAFLATASPTIHDFWRNEDPGQRQNDMIHFSKNLALLGAALALMGVEEPWPASLQAARPRTRCEKLAGLLTFA